MDLITKIGSLNESELMLIVLGLVDVVMIANLLSMAIIGISSIHLLRTFVQAQSLYATTPHAGEIILWQTVIHSPSSSRRWPSPG